jgi:hypothetical protein
MHTCIRNAVGLVRTPLFRWHSFVTHYCVDMMTANRPMTATGASNESPEYVEGVTVGDFTRRTGGSVIIEAEQ